MEPEISAVSSVQYAQLLRWSCFLHSCAGPPDAGSAERFSMKIMQRNWFRRVADNRISWRRCLADGGCCGECTVGRPIHVSASVDSDEHRVAAACQEVGRGSDIAAGHRESATDAKAIGPLLYVVLVITCHYHRHIRSIRPQGSIWLPVISIAYRPGRSVRECAMAVVEIENVEH